MASSVPEYDIIFAGGGTIAGVIAGRLATADPTLKILLVEAGPHTLMDDMHVQPARYLTHLSPTSTTARFYLGKTTEHTGNRDVVVPAGACVGGGSSINFCMYTRAAASDYDDWENQFGNEGWSSKYMIPLLKKTESYQLPDGRNPHDTHGYSGPLKVSYGGHFTNVGKDFLEAAKVVDPNRPIVPDINSLRTADGYGRWQKWIGAGTGKRSDVAHHFIYTQEKNTNLTLLTGAVVHKVIFEGTKAVGVEYGFDQRFHPGESAERRVQARAKRLVVVSAGAFGSPQLLERSGIGAKAILEAVKVPQLVDLPGVGECYQDHQVIFSPYLASDESDTLDGIVRSKPEDINKWEGLWKEEGSGMMAHNSIDAGGKIRPTPEELKELGPAFESRWKEYFENAPDKPVMWIGALSMYVGNMAAVPDRKYFCVGFYVQYPTSYGSVHINSLEPLSNPNFNPGYLQTADDLTILKFGYKRSREFARRMACYRGEYVPDHAVFGPNSAAHPVADAKPVGPNEPKIQFTAEDDKAIEDYVRSHVGTAWHSLGTCAMKPREKGGVVDSKLNVYGTTNLKVADMSICPGNVSANTYSTALTVGEKAAVIIAQELGIIGVSAF